MLIKINGDLLEDLKATLHETDAVFSNSSLVNHVAQFYGIDTNREAQALYDEAVQEEIRTHSIIAAAKVKAYLSVHVFDLHNLSNHMHDILGMTN